MEELTTAERQWKCWCTASCHAAEPFLWSLDFGLLGSRETLLHGSSKIFVEHSRRVAKIWFPADLGPISRKSHNGKLFCVCCVCIQDQSFNNFENNTMDLSVKEEKLTGAWARNCDTIQQVLIFKFAFGPEKKFPGLSRNGPLGLIVHALATAGSLVTISSINKRILSLEKTSFRRENKISD